MNKKFFFWYMRHLNIIKKENNKYWSIIINDAKNEKFGEKIKNISPFITEIRNKKVKILKKQSKNLKMMKTTNVNRTSIFKFIKSS